MRSALLGFVAGAALLQQQASLPSWLLLACMFCAALGAALLLHRVRNDRLRAAARFACGLLAGFAWAALFAQAYLARELPAEWEGRDVTLVGTVDSLPHRFERGLLSFRNRAG